MNDMHRRLHYAIATRAGRAAWFVLATLVLTGCSLPRLAYNNADTLLRFKGTEYFEPSYQQDLLMSAAIRRVHAWHRRQELPRYAAGLDDMAQRLERGLNDDDVHWLRRFVRARSRVLAAKTVDEALPALHTLKPDNLAALERELAKRNDDYAEEFLSGDDARRQRAQRDQLQEHFERWTGSLDDAQVALIERFVADQPRFAALRLENRVQLQRQGLAILQRMMAGDAQADAALRDLLVNWERHATPAYRNALREWEDGMTQLVQQLDRSLRPEQRGRAVRTLRSYAGDLYALTDGVETPTARATTQAAAR